MSQSHDTDGTDRQTAANPQRGCGYLKEGKAYLRSNISPDGTLPPVVEFEHPIMWLEGQLRGYSHFPGIQFELTVTPPAANYLNTCANGVDADGETYQAVGEATSPTAVRDYPESVDAAADVVPGGEWKTRTMPPMEVDRHVERLGSDADISHPGSIGNHVGEIRAARANDLLMWVGKTHYPTPETFIDECKQHGLSKAIPVGKNQAPPVINPGRTRVFLVHPNAVSISSEPVGDDDEDGYRPGIIGYAYVTDVIYTGVTDDDGDVQFPEWAQEYADADRVQLTEIGERVPEEAQANGSLGDFVDDSDDGSDDEATADGGSGGAVDYDSYDDVPFQTLYSVAAAHDAVAEQLSSSPDRDEVVGALRDADVSPGEVRQR